MKIVKMKCPECNAGLQYDPTKPMAYCPYCGTQLYFDDEVRRSEHRSYHEERIVHEEITDDKTKKNKYEFWLIIAMFVFLIVWMLVMKSLT